MVDASVLVVGAGAIGGITAAGMQGSVKRVTVLDANREHVARLRDPGLELDRLGAIRTVALDARTSPDELDGHYDYGLIALKAPAIETALMPLAARGLVETFVTLGNGLMHDRVADIVGGQRMIVGTVEWGATNLGAGRLRQTTDNPFVIGEPQGPRQPRTERLATVLAPVAAVHITDNIQGQLWSKLLVNSVLSALGVVTGLTYAGVAAAAYGPEAICALWREGHELGLAQGLALEAVLGIDAADLASADERVWRPALDAVIGHAGATRASMLQDVERGLKTEVDVINGGVVARARQIGREAPLNGRVVEIVQSFERGERSPSPALLAEVLGVAAESPAAPTGDAGAGG